MDVLGHDDIAHQEESVAVAHRPEHLDENISGANRAQEGHASITREGNEMEVAAPVVANELDSHENAKQVKTPTL